MHIIIFIDREVFILKTLRVRDMERRDGEDEIVSSVMFIPYDTGNRKQSTNWMVFYSVNRHHISYIGVM